MTNEEFQKLVLQELSAIKTQQQENTDLINALIHNIEVANAKIDGLTLNTATKNAVLKQKKYAFFVVILWCRFCYVFATYLQRFCCPTCSVSPASFILSALDRLSSGFIRNCATLTSSW